jgi:hypothetical protein
MLLLRKCRLRNGQAAITEGGVPINVTLTSSSTYPDVVGTSISRDYPLQIDYMPNDPIVLSWPSDSPKPLYAGTMETQNFSVEVDGFPLNPAIVNRFFQTTPPNGLVITWPN